MTTKTIHTLVEDIGELLKDETHLVPSEESLSSLGTNVAGHVGGYLEERTSKREIGKMWPSEIGQPCLRKIWYSYRVPTRAEPMGYSVRFKFLYGNIIEELLLYLAGQSGHTVESEQEVVETELDGWRIRGRLDAVVDDVLVDVKSCSSYAFKKYASEGVTSENDTFGYLYQLAFYKYFTDHNNNKKAGFLFVDKQLGHICYKEALDLPTKEQLIDKIRRNIKAITQDQEYAVPRGYSDKPQGKSGNKQLGFECSYCPFKHTCWPGLTGYRYSFGPVYLTKIVNEPRVPRL